MTWLRPPHPNSQLHQQEPRPLCGQFFDRQIETRDIACVCVCVCVCAWVSGGAAHTFCVDARIAAGVRGQQNGGRGGAVASVRAFLAVGESAIFEMFQYSVDLSLRQSGNDNIIVHNIGRKWKYRRPIARPTLYLSLRRSRTQLEPVSSISIEHVASTSLLHPCSNES